MIHCVKNKDRRTFIKFVCSSFFFCIEMSFCKSIRRFEELNNQIDGNKSIGSVLLYEQDIPVFHLSKLLEENCVSNTQAGKILIIGFDTQYCGLLVDDINSVMECDTSEIYTISKFVGNNAFKWFEGFIKNEEVILPILSLNNLWLKRDEDDKHIVEYPISKYLYKNYHWHLSKYDSNKQLIVFSDNSKVNVKYGLSLSQVLKVISPVKLTKIPGSHPYILGLFEWDGMILPLIQLSLYLGDSNLVNTLYSRWLIIKVQTLGLFVGVAIQSQVDIITLPIENNVSNCILTLDKNMILGKFDVENFTLVMLDADHIFVQKAK